MVQGISGYMLPSAGSAQPGTLQPGTLPANGTAQTGAQSGGALGSALLGAGWGNLGSDISGGGNATGGSGNWSLISSGGTPGTYASNPTQVQISPDILNSMSQYSDAAYQNATRTLDPQWQQQQSQFAQQMVSQGLQPGTQAYDNAMADFSRGRNDAYSQARDQSMQQGLQAQGQSFQEGLANSTLANEIERANIAASGQVAAAGVGANASMHDADVSNATQRLLGLGNLGLGYGALENQTNQTNSNIYNQTNQSDFGIMNGLTGDMNQTDMYNNSIPGQQINNFNQLYQNVPHGGPQPVDVNGAYQMQQNGQNAAYQGNVANSNSQNQMIGALGTAAIMAMMMCSRTLKDDQGAMDPETTLEAVNSLPLHRWNYKGEKVEHVGTFAEDFNTALNLPKSQAIQVIDILGALLGSVQALTKRIEAIEAR
jgi:hypothetical protein